MASSSLEEWGKRGECGDVIDAFKSEPMRKVDLIAYVLIRND